MGTVDHKRDADKLKPYITAWLREMTGRAPSTGGSGGTVALPPTPPPPLTAHVLATATALGTYHTVSGLTANMVLKALGPTSAAFGQLLHNQLGGIGPNDHHAQSHVLATAGGLGGDHTISGATVGHVLRASAPDAAAFAQLQHNDLGGVTSDQHHAKLHGMLDTDHHSYTGGAALDVFGLSDVSTLALLTPSADVSNGATALLRSNAGALGVNVLVAGGSSPYVSSPRFTATGDMTLDPTGDIILSPSGNDVKTAQTTSFISTNYLTGFPLAGFRLGPTLLAGQSGLRIGIVEADELRVRIFVADETRVDRGQEYITKSYGLLSEPFTCPASVGGTADIYFENSPNLGVDGALFTANDWILLRYLDIATGIDLLNCWGQVSGTPVYTNNAETGIRQQRWTFTFRYGTSSLLFNRGSMGIDFGQSGQGYILSDAVSIDSPAITVGRWVTNPYTPANRTILTGIGALVGLGFTGEYGLAASVAGFTAADQWVKVSQSGAQFNNVPIYMYNGAANTGQWQSNGSLLLSNTNAGVVAERDFEYNAATSTLRIGTLYSAKPNLYWDGASLHLRQYTTPVITLSSDGSSYFAGRMTIGTSGEIVQGSGTLGTAGTWTDGVAWGTFTGLRIGSASGVGRLGGYSAGVLQAGFSSSGKITAGGENVVLSAAGVNVSGNSLVSAGGLMPWEPSGAPLDSDIKYNASLNLVNGGLGVYHVMQEVSPLGTVMNTGVIEVKRSTSYTPPGGSARSVHASTWLRLIANYIEASGSISAATTLSAGNTILDQSSGTYRGLSMQAFASATWAFGLTYRNSVNTILGSWGAYGTADALSYLYGGVNYGDTTLRIYPATDRVGIGPNVVPSYTLDVTGTFRATGAATVASLASSGAVSGTTGTFSAAVSGTTINATTGFQRDGVAGYLFVPMAPTNMTDTGAVAWNGVSRAAGTYTFDVNSAANGSVPAEAKAVALFGTFSWTNSNNLTYATIQAPSAAYGIVARAVGSGVGSDVTGIVMLDANGQFTVTIVNATSNVSLLRIVGYYI